MSSQPHGHHTAFTWLRHMLLNTQALRTSLLHGDKPLHRSDNPRSKARIGPLFQATNTRIQMHQNLFTLTKNKSAPRQFSLGTNIRLPSPQTFSGIAGQKIETRLSLQQHRIQPPDSNHQAANHGGDGRNRTDDPLLAKQVLSQLSY